MWTRIPRTLGQMSTPGLIQRTPQLSGESFVGLGDNEGALYALENVNAPGNYMNVQGDSFNRGANVHMWNNPWSPASQWYITPSGIEGHSGRMGYVIESSRAVGQYTNLQGASTGL